MSRFWAMALKELRQIRRDRRLTISLIVPPTLQILLFGFALDSDVRNLRLGVVGVMVSITTFVVFYLMTVSGLLWVTSAIGYPRQ